MKRLAGEAGALARPSTTASATAARAPPSWPRRWSRPATGRPTSSCCTPTTRRSRRRSRRSRPASTAPTASTSRPRAIQQLKRFQAQGLGHFAVCMAKTHLSLSADPNVKGRPRGFRIPVRDVRAYTGAGFIVPLCGDMLQMPGLGKHAGRLQHRHRRGRQDRRDVLAAGSVTIRALCTETDIGAPRFARAAEAGGVRRRYMTRFARPERRPSRGRRARCRGCGWFQA